MAVRYFYVCFILKLSLVAGQSVHYVLKGREAILSPSLSSQPDDILWKHNGDKVITFDNSQETVFGLYEGRVTLAWDTAELTITDVRYEDSGEYELEVLISKKMDRSQYMLKVLDKVAKPVITCEMNDESSNETSRPRATLLCSSQSNAPEALTFKWNLDGAIQSGQELNISLVNEHDKTEYSCTATNPLHAETSIFMAKDCYKAERSSGALDILVPIIIAALILFAFSLFLIIYCYYKKRACFKTRRNDDLENQKVAVQNRDDESRPLMAHNIHRQETFPSKQKLPQNENGNVTETPQKQEIRKDLEELNANLAGKVKKNAEMFEKGKHTEWLADTQTGEENKTDSDERTISQPASPSSISNSGLSGLESKEQQRDSEGEQDVEPSEHNDAQETQADVDPSSVQPSPEESPKASEHTELQPQSLSQSSESLVDQDSPLGTGEVESKEQADSEGEPDVHHSDKPAESQSQQGSQTGPCEPESKVQGESGEESKTEPTNEEPQRDKSDYKSLASARKESVSQPRDEEPDKTSKQPDSTGDKELQREDLNQEANDSEPGSLSQPAPQSSAPPESDQDPREKEGAGHEESNNVLVDKETPRDLLDHKEDEDSETVDKEISPPDSEPPGSEKKADKTQPPTHEAAPPVSEHTDNTESKDTDDERTQDADSDQVSTKTEDITDKKSDSSSSKETNETDNVNVRS